MVLHFALLVFITSCVKVITFRVVITSCVNGITSRGDYYILRQYYILRRNMRLLYYILIYAGAVCAWVAGVRTCMYVCEHCNVYVYVCAGACAWYI